MDANMTIESTNAAPTPDAIGTKIRTVPPGRRLNAEVRTREYLTLPEIEQLMKAAKGEGRRHGLRDATMILLAFRHALRVTELVNLRWRDVDFYTARLNVNRLKRSVSGVHPLVADELRALRRLRKDAPHDDFLFMTERGAPMTQAGFRKLLTRVADRAGLSALKVHPHALRHSCGYALVNKGKDTRTLQDYMGHKQIANTVRYTALNSSRFTDLWR